MSPDCRRTSVRAVPKATASPMRPHSVAKSAGLGVSSDSWRRMGTPVVSSTVTPVAKPSTRKIQK